MRHATRTAKVIELVCSSTKSFEDAIRCGIEDTTKSTRNVRGAEVMNMSVSCDNGKITEYKVNMHVAFGVERKA